jgi:RNA polymerase sigma factor (sigma-70 family)
MDLSELIGINRGPLLGLIVSWGATWADAVEIAQDSFAEAYLKRECCRGDWTQPEVFGRWLRGVARNQYRNWARGRRRRERVLKFESPVVEQAAASPESKPSEQLERLRQAIHRLPDKLRQVVLMHYLEESSVNQVAVLLSVSAKTVESRLYRARRSLRQMLDKEPPAARIGEVLRCL